jgi:hypothetical protein
LAIAQEVLCNHATVSACESSVSLLGAGQPLDRAITAISPLTRSLEGAATLFRTRPLPCHHPLTGNWDGSLISTRSHWRMSSRTTEAILAHASSPQPRPDSLCGMTGKTWLRFSMVRSVCAITRTPKRWKRLREAGMRSAIQGGHARARRLCARHMPAEPSDYLARIIEIISELPRLFSASNCGGERWWRKPSRGLSKLGNSQASIICRREKRHERQNR